MIELNSRTAPLHQRQLFNLASTCCSLGNTNQVWKVHRRYIDKVARECLGGGPGVRIFPYPYRWSK